MSRQTFLQPILPENLWFISNAVLDNLKSRTHGKENELAVLKDDEEDLGSQVTLTELEEPVTASQEIHTQMIASHDPDYFGNDVTSVVVGCDCTAADEALDVFRKENTETEGRAPLEEDAMTTSLLQLYTGENPAMSLKCPLRESPVQPATFMNLPVMNSESLESDHYFGSFDFDSFDQSPFQNSDTRALSTSVNSNETNLSAPAENGITERQGEAELTKTVKSDLSSISERNLDLEFCLPLPDAFLCSFLDETKSDTEAMEKDSNPISSQFLDLRRTSSGESLSGIINGWESKLSASEYVEGGHTSSTSHFNDPNCFSGTEEPEALNRLTCLPLDLPSFGTDWKAEDMMPKCIAFPLASYDIKLSPKPKAPAAKPVFKKISSVFMDANTSQIEQQNKVFSSEKNFEELPMSLFDQRKGPSVHVLKTARISSVPFEHLGPSSSETVMEKSVCDHLNRPSDVDAKSVTKITHKKVSFGSAWKGELETVRYIQDRCHSPIINPDADGLIILQCKRFKSYVFAYLLILM